MGGNETHEGDLERDREQWAICEKLLDPADEREYFVYLTNRKWPLTGPTADLSEFSYGALFDRFDMGYTNLWVLQRYAVYADSEWRELRCTAAPRHSRAECADPGSPHFVLLAMGDWPSRESRRWRLVRGTECCSAAEARRVAAELVDAARREGFGDVPPLLCALRLHNYGWH
jgi:hypothetical protein